MSWDIYFIFSFLLLLFFGSLYADSEASKRAVLIEGSFHNNKLEIINGKKREEKKHNKLWKTKQRMVRFELLETSDDDDHDVEWSGREWESWFM